MNKNKKCEHKSLYGIESSPGTMVRMCADCGEKIDEVPIEFSGWLKEGGKE